MKDKLVFKLRLGSKFYGYVFQPACRIDIEGCRYDPTFWYTAWRGKRFPESYITKEAAITQLIHNAHRSLNDEERELNLRLQRINRMQRELTELNTTLDKPTAIVID